MQQVGDTCGPGSIQPDQEQFGEAVLHSSEMQYDCLLIMMLKCADSTAFHSKNKSGPKEGPVCLKAALFLEFIKSL